MWQCCSRQIQLSVTDRSTNVGCGCGTSGLGDSQRLSGHGPEQLALNGPAWAGDWTRWTPEVPSNLNWSVIQQQPLKSKALEKQTLNSQSAVGHKELITSPKWVRQGGLWHFFVSFGICGKLCHIQWQCWIQRNRALTAHGTVGLMPPWPMCFKSHVLQVACRKVTCGCWWRLI